MSSLGAVALRPPRRSSTRSTIFALEICVGASGRLEKSVSVSVSQRAVSEPVGDGATPGRPTSTAGCTFDSLDPCDAAAAGNKTAATTTACTKCSIILPGQFRGVRRMALYVVRDHQHQ